MKKKILSFCLAIAMIVPVIFLLSACGEKQKGDPVIDFEIIVGDTHFKEDGGCIETTYGLWPSFDEFKTSIAGQIFYESGGANFIEPNELLVTCSDDGYQTMKANENGYTVTVNWENYSISFTLIVNKAIVDVSNAQLSAPSEFCYDGEVKTVELVGITVGNGEPPEGVVNCSTNQAVEVGDYRLRAVINNPNYIIFDGEKYLETWTGYFDWKIVECNSY